MLFKGLLPGLRQFLTTASSLKKTKNGFYFMFNPLFVLEIFTFSSCVFGYIKKLFGKKVKVKSKIYDVTERKTNIYSTHIAQYLKT